MGPNHGMITCARHILWEAGACATRIHCPPEWTNLSMAVLSVFPGGRSHMPALLISYARPLVPCCTKVALVPPLINPLGAHTLSASHLSAAPLLSPYAFSSLDQSLSLLSPCHQLPASRSLTHSPHHHAPLLTPCSFALPARLLQNPPSLSASHANCPACKLPSCLCQLLTDAPPGSPIEECQALHGSAVVEHAGGLLRGWPLLLLPA